MAAGLSRKQIYGRVYGRLRRTAAEVARLVPGLTMKYGNGALTGKFGGKDVQVGYRILRASNGEVAGMPYVKVGDRVTEGWLRGSVAENVARMVEEAA